MGLIQHTCLHFVEINSYVHLYFASALMLLRYSIFIMILYRWLKGTHHFQQSKTLKLLNLMPTKSVPLSEHLPNFIPTDSKSMSLQTFSLNNYDHGWYFGSIRDLIQWLLSLYRLIQECWSENPANRPTFKQIISRLESIHNKFGPRRFWKVNWTEPSLRRLLMFSAYHWFLGASLCTGKTIEMLSESGFHMEEREFQLEWPVRFSSIYPLNFFASFLSRYKNPFFHMFFCCITLI